MTSQVPLKRITDAIIEIENCRAYDTPDMKSAKDSWLKILYDARDRYESLEEKEFRTVNFALCIHYLNYTQVNFQRELRATMHTMVNVLKKISEKQLEFINGDEKEDISRQDNKPDEKQNETK